MNIQLDKLKTKDRLARVWWWFASFFVLRNAKERMRKNRTPNCDVLLWNSFRQSNNFSVTVAGETTTIRFGDKNNFELEFYHYGRARRGILFSRARPDYFKVRNKFDITNCWAGRATLAYILIQARLKYFEEMETASKKEKEKLKNTFYENFVNEKGL